MLRTYYIIALILLILSPLQNNLQNTHQLILPLSLSLLSILLPPSQNPFDHPNSLHFIMLVQPSYILSFCPSVYLMRKGNGGTGEDVMEEYEGGYVFRMRDGGELRIVEEEEWSEGYIGGR